MGRNVSVAINVQSHSLAHTVLLLIGLSTIKSFLRPPAILTLPIKDEFSSTLLDIFYLKKVLLVRKNLFYDYTMESVLFFLQKVVAIV